MRVELRINRVTANGVQSRGQEIEVDAAEGAELIRTKKARAIEPAEKPAKETKKGKRP